MKPSSITMGKQSKKGAGTCKLLVPKCECDFESKETLHVQETMDQISNQPRVVLNVVLCTRYGWSPIGDGHLTQILTSESFCFFGDAVLHLYRQLLRQTPTAHVRHGVSGVEWLPFARKYII